MQWPANITFRPREELEAVQKELAEVEGTTVLLFDQTCAAEKRRRRKRNAYPDPDMRIIINELVCEGCGDCGVKSNCVSVQPLDTEFGRKRMIDQSSCNKDYSCVNGFCPSFVIAHGAKPKKVAPVASASDSPPLPPLPVLQQIGAHPYGVLVTGIGGTGVVTIGAILGMAAHLEGKGCGMIDMAGLAQKGGAVYSHVKLANRPEDINAIRVAAREADLVLGCDFVVSGSKKVLAAVKPGATGMVVNTAEVYPGDFARNADFSLPTQRIRKAIADAGARETDFIDATNIATALLGNAIAANMFLMGFAFQKGLIPLSAQAIRKAIELNGEAVAMNQSAFDWGRRAAHDPASVERLIAPARKFAARDIATTLDEIVAKRVDYLTAYQNRAYAERYRAAVARVADAEKAKTPGKSGLAETVAKNLFKLMAIKDEYEVARLYSDGSFKRQLDATFEGVTKLEYSLAPPMLAPIDDTTGLPKKMRFGAWMGTAFAVLAKFKGLRGGPLDIFGRTEERRMERKLRDDYEALLAELERGLTPANHALAAAIAAIPEKIRGFGYVKERNVKAAKAEEARLLERWRKPDAPLVAAAE
jgi:indolepyruvate ferredoxin oxidoreductase